MRVGEAANGYLPLMVCTLAAAAVAQMAAAAGDAVTTAPAPAAFRPYIVNGTATSGYPTTGVLLSYEDASLSTLNVFCSGTLIGCHTFITAAHCVCPNNSNTAGMCQNQGVSDPSTLRVFFQHAGFFAVTRVEIHPDYSFGEAGDLALLTLSEPVTGIAPSPLNTLQRPAAGTIGTIAGFGSTSAARNATDDAGIKREGGITTALCTGGLPNATTLCWNFLGEGASTCEGDSGGPLFIDFGTGPALAGVTSGGENMTCQAPDVPFDTDVFVYTSWIASQAGGDVGSTPCGDLVPVGMGSTAVLDSAGQLTAAQPTAQWEFAVPAATDRLRIALNGVPWSGSPVQTSNDFDLYVRAGSAASTSQYDCRDTNSISFGFCEIAAPAAGTWSVLVNRISGVGLYQLTATAFGPATSTGCRGDCNTDGAVTVDELLASVGIALGNTGVTACRAADFTNDGAISIDELLTAVNSALNAC